MTISKSIHLHLNAPKLNVKDFSIKHLIVGKILTWNHVHFFKTQFNNFTLLSDLMSLNRFNQLQSILTNV